MFKKRPFCRLTLVCKLHFLSSLLSWTVLPMSLSTCLPSVFCGVLLLVVILVTLWGGFWPLLFCLLLLQLVLCVIHFWVELILELRVAFSCILFVAYHFAIYRKVLADWIAALSRSVSSLHIRMWVWTMFLVLLFRRLSDRTIGRSVVLLPISLILR